MPTLNFDWNKVDAVRRARMDDAETYAKKVNKGQSFYDWLHIGQGLSEWQLGACELAGTQDMDTPAYRAAWRAALPLYPELAKIAGDERQKAERSYAIWMWENHEILETWHAGLGDRKRRVWNHPRTIWNHSPLGKAAKAAQRASIEPRNRKTVTRDLHEAVERIAGVADQFERTTGGATALIFDMSPELIGESARNFVDIYGPEDTVRFIDELRAIVAPRAEPSPPLDPAFAGSLQPSLKPATKAPPEKLIQAVWACRIEHRGWDHKQIARKVRRAGAVVTRILEDPDCARVAEDDEALRRRFWALRQRRPDLLPAGFARELKCTNALAENLYGAAAGHWGEQGFIAGEWHLSDDEAP